jgi:hypothetical protein
MHMNTRIPLDGRILMLGCGSVDRCMQGSGGPSPSAPKTGAGSKVPEHHSLKTSSS